MDTKQAQEQIIRYFRARYPMVAILTHEEKRVLDFLTNYGMTKGKAVAVWSLTSGLVGCDSVEPGDTQDPIALLATLRSWITEKRTSHIICILDFHNLMNDAMTVRYLRDLADLFGPSNHNIVFISPAFKIPADMEKQVVSIDYPLPGVDELKGIVSRVEVNLPESIPCKLNGGRDAVVRSMLGLTAFEAESALLAGIAAKNRLDDSVVSAIVKEKAQIIKKSGLLEYFDTDLSMADVGGLGNLKTYAKIKLSTFSAKAAEKGIEPARGVLLAGVPGTGKSLCAKAIAGGRMPLLRLDLGALLGGVVGQSEANMRGALKVAETIAPCVLWIDEIEKGLADNEGRSDGGVKMNMLGQLLTWMQERKSPVYIVATANSANLLKPELISRFDDTFWVELPSESARLEIISIHLAKRNITLEGDLRPVVVATWGMSGREIERVVKSAFENAFFSDTVVTVQSLVEAAEGTQPIAKTMSESIAMMREWAAKGQVKLAGEKLENKPDKAEVEAFRLLAE